MYSAPLIYTQWFLKAAAARVAMLCGKRRALSFLLPHQVARFVAVYHPQLTAIGKETKNNEKKDY